MGFAFRLIFPQAARPCQEASVEFRCAARQPPRSAASSADSRTVVHIHSTGPDRSLGVYFTEFVRSSYVLEPSFGQIYSSYNPEAP